MAWAPTQRLSLLLMVILSGVQALEALRDGDGLPGTGGRGRVGVKSLWGGVCG